MKVLVGSQNPVKLEATKEAFSKYFEKLNVEVEGIKVNSKVPDQPIANETFEGARNRAFELKRINDEKNLNANFFVGIEGGLKKLFSIWFAFGVVCILDDNERIGYGTSPFFELPERITKELLKGKGKGKGKGLELGEVMDNLTGEENTKQKQGAVGYFTKGVMDRKQYYTDALIVALIPFLNKDLYFEK